MALDFGLSQIGMAVGEELDGAVQPLGAVRAKKGTPLWSQMDAAVREWQPHLLLVGLPLHMDGSAGAMARRAERFAASLKCRYRVPVTLTDERLSTDSARPHWDGRDKTELQGLSAAVILEDWLSRQPEKKPRKLPD